MRPDISEFSYGYALTEELVHAMSGAIEAAPLFPSLIEEGRAGGGYDVQIPFVGVPLFLQFKLSHKMIRATAYEAQEGLLNIPFYRMHLRPRKHSRQHDLLLELEAEGREVFYAAPRFHEPSELNRAYLTRSVVAESMFFRPSTIGPLPDDDEHSVSFEDSGVAWLCSDPKQLEGPFVGPEVLEKALADELPGRSTFDGSRESLEAMSDQLLRIVRERGLGAKSLDEFQIDDRLPRHQIAYPSRAYFASEILLVRRREEPQHDQS